MSLLDAILGIAGQPRIPNAPGTRDRTPKHRHDPSRSEEWNAWRERQALHPTGKIRQLPARQGGPVRVGRFSPRPTRHAAPVVDCEIPVRGRPGLVEVRRSGGRERMVAYRRRPVRHDGTPA